MFRSEGIVEWGNAAVQGERRAVDVRVYFDSWAIFTFVLLSRWLLKKVFLVDVTDCPDCGGRMKWMEACTEAPDIHRVLLAHGLAPRAPPSTQWAPLGQLRFSF